jgi:hypothetical protein
MENQNQLPTPPMSADLVQIHKYLLSLNNWLKLFSQTGVQATNLGQSQLDAMVSANDLTQAGKIFFNTNTLKTQKATVVTGNLTITDF